MFKVVSFLFACFLFFTSTTTYAQNQQNENHRAFAKTFYNVAYNDLFLEHPRLDSIALEFDGKKPVFMTWYSSQPQKTKVLIDYFDLGFEGDRHLLESKHAIRCLPALPADQLIFMDSLQQLVTYFKLNAIIYSDSITYRFLPPPFYHASYSGDIRQLGSQLQEIYEDNRFGISIDSVLIFQGIVNQGGSLDNVDLISGLKSDFSDAVKAFLEKQGNGTWNPMVKDGRPLRSLVDISVRLSNNKNLVVSFTGRGRKLRIEDKGGESMIFY